jgi:2-(1,2-epoxy-1,2-dihydrophenyl)acetyl-CoA isomerase
VPGDELESVTRELAERLASGPFAQSQIKRQLRASAQNTLGQQLELEIETQGLASESDDCHEGITAFLERRRAQFAGR